MRRVLLLFSDPGRWAPLIALAALAFAVVAAVASASPSPEFWFVEANEGQSAGGHAALRLGPRVYHLEHRGDGLIADRRTSPRRFIEIYADRGNRRIEAVPLALSPEKTRSLEIFMAERYADRTQRLAALDALDDEIRWLGSVEKTGALSVSVPGLGLFDRTRALNRCQNNGEMTHRSAEALVRIEAARSRTRTQLSLLLEGAGEAEQADSLPMRPIEPGGRLRRLIQAVRTEFALELVLGCSSEVRPSALIRTDTRLLAADRSKWIAAKNRLSSEIEALLGSPRTDIGLPLLLAWARRAAIAETLSTNQVHVLAPFDEDPNRVSRAFTRSSVSVADEVPLPWRRLRELEIADRWTQALADFAHQDGPLEARLFQLERAHHSLRHLEEATLHDPVRPESRSPSASEAYASDVLTLPWPPGTPFSNARETRRRRERVAGDLRQSLEEELRYGLLTRNCVSELSVALATIQSAEADPRKFRTAQDGRLSLAEILSGAFIPEVVAHRVETALAKEARRVLPSTRERFLERGRREIQQPLARFVYEGREFLTLTSQTYRSNQDDSRFLFFSDDLAVIRPLIGLANLSYGFAASALGLLEAPFDRGIGLRRGLQGIAMSVPELFFFQVRQGSYRVAPPGALAPSAGSTETR